MSTVFPRYTTYKGERHRLMLLDEALVEYNAQKAQGKKPTIVSLPDGYIVVEAMFEKEGGKNNVS